MFGFARKIGMTRLFIDGRSIPVTAIEFADQVILQKKTQETDGYKALQVGAFARTKATKAAAGHAKKYADKEESYICLEEFTLKDDQEVTEIKFEDFAAGDLLELAGTTKGKGFTGAVKKYGFHGQPASHGHDHVKAVGSIGTRWPQRTLPGKKMAGRMGGDKQTLKKAKILVLDAEKKLFFIKGSIPGPNGGYLKISKLLS
jgi:large subunit ribosomal protein L3